MMRDSGSVKLRWAFGVGRRLRRVRARGGGPSASGRSAAWRSRAAQLGLRGRRGLGGRRAGLGFERGLGGPDLGDVSRGGQCRRQLVPAPAASVLGAFGGIDVLSSTTTSGSPSPAGRSSCPKTIGIG